MRGRVRFINLTVSIRIHENYRALSYQCGRGMRICYNAMHSKSSLTHEDILFLSANPQKKNEDKIRHNWVEVEDRVCLCIFFFFIV